MQEHHHEIVIVGGGTAGITVAARLKRADRSLDVAIIEPSDKHYYQPLWTLVGAGVMDKEATERNEARYIPTGVTWIRDRVAELVPDEHAVVTSDGTRIGYSQLILAPGIQLDWDAVEGLTDTLGQNGVCSNYAYDQVDYTWETLRSFRGGNAVFTNPAGQVKCGGAPQKIMYLADDYLRKNSMRDRSRVIGAFAGTKMLGVPEINATLERIVREREIEMRFRHNLIAVDGPQRIATFEVTDPDTGETSTAEIPFDMLHVTPPMSAPDFVAASPLAVEEGPHRGYADVDDHTLQSARYPDVFALGDAAALPTAKTGAAVRKQAPVLVANLLAHRSREALEASYDGYSSCPLVTSYNRLVLAEFTYGNEYKPTFPVDQTKERLDMYLLKRYVLPLLYWRFMLRGLA